MAHEITDTDNMLSVRELPWHGLGNVLSDYPTVEEAIVASGLTWNVSMKTIEYMQKNPATGRSRPAIWTNNRLVVRDDIGAAIGMVGSAYVPYQNSQMWEFIRDFTTASGSKIETAGSLRGGAVTWVMTKAQELEYLKDDPMMQFFLFKNCFNGGKSIEILFTNIRVVCNNTMTMALEGASNVYRVRHLSNAETRLKDIQATMTRHAAWNVQMREAMELLAKTPMVEAQMIESVRNVYGWKLFEPTEEKTSAQLEEEANRGVQRLVTNVMELVETGAGADIPGVKGTAYGLLQAIIEREDHFRDLRDSPERTWEEARFELNLSNPIKDQAMNNLIRFALAA